MNFHEYFEKKGIAKKDVPLALACYKGIGLGITLITFGVCYRYKPLRRLIKTDFMDGQITKFKAKYPERYNKCENFIKTKIEKISNSKFFKPIPNMFGLKSRNFTKSVCETLIISKVGLPITIPFQFLSTMKIIEVKYKMNSQDNI